MVIMKNQKYILVNKLFYKINHSIKINNRIFKLIIIKLKSQKKKYNRLYFLIKLNEDNISLIEKVKSNLNNDINIDQY